MIGSLVMSLLLLWCLYDSFRWALNTGCICLSVCSLCVRLFLHFALPFVCLLIHLPLFISPFLSIFFFLFSISLFAYLFHLSSLLFFIHFLLPLSLLSLLSHLPLYLSICIFIHFPHLTFSPSLFTFLISLLSTFIHLPLLTFIPSLFTFLFSLFLHLYSLCSSHFFSIFIHLSLPLRLLHQRVSTAQGEKEEARQEEVNHLRKR